jgi:prophage regulatory protein
MRMIRLPEVKTKTGHGRSTIYQRVKLGLLPPPVRISDKSSAWPDDEIDAVNHALVAGQSTSEIRTLVATLVGNRKKRATNSR